MIKRASVEFIEVTPSKKGRTEDDDGKEMNTAEATLQKLESIMKDNEKSTEDKMNEVNSVLAGKLINTTITSHRISILTIMLVQLVKSSTTTEKQPLEDNDHVLAA